MINEVSQAVASNTATGTSGVSQSKPSKANEAVQPSDSAANARSAEVSAFQDLGEKSAAVQGEQVEELVEELNELVQQVERQIQFSIDENSGRTVIRVIDSATEKVIREIPPEEILTLRRRLGEVRGVLFKTEA